MLRDDLEGWDGKRVGAQERGDAHIIMLDLHCFTAETNTTL